MRMRSRSPLCSLPPLRRQQLLRRRHPQPRARASLRGRRGASTHPPLPSLTSRRQGRPSRIRQRGIWQRGIWQRGTRRRDRHPPPKPMEMVGRRRVIRSPLVSVCARHAMGRPRPRCASQDHCSRGLCLLEPTAPSPQPRPEPHPPSAASSSSTSRRRPCRRGAAGIRPGPLDVCSAVWSNSSSRSHSRERGPGRPAGVSTALHTSPLQRINRKTLCRLTDTHTRIVANFNLE